MRGIDLSQKGALLNRFAAVHANETELGFQSGNIDGVMLTSAAASENARGINTRRAAQQKQQRADADFIRELYQLGELDTFIAENVVMSMNDIEVVDTITAIEEHTGQGFESYAHDVLGAKMPDRRAGESDDDFNRRVLILLADEMLNDDLSIKPGFEDSPLVQILKDDAAYWDALDIVQSRDPRAVVNADSENGAYSQANSAAEVATNDAIVATSRKAQDEQRDAMPVESFGALSMNNSL